MVELLQIYPTHEELIVHACQQLISQILLAVHTRGHAFIVLTGGSNGCRLAHHLGRCQDPVPWEKVHFFFGDERFVDSQSSDRNSQQIINALGSICPIPQHNIHPMPAYDHQRKYGLQDAANQYSHLLEQYVNWDQPDHCFDVHLLGMGSEGHVNSLFPHHYATHNPHHYYVVGVSDSPKPPPQRITLTLQAIQHSRQVWLLVSGHSKAHGVAQAIICDDPMTIPASAAKGREKTLWFLDYGAASQLP